MIPWMTCGWPLGLILVGWLILERFNHCCVFYPFIDDELDILFEFQSIYNGLGNLLNNTFQWFCFLSVVH